MAKIYILKEDVPGTIGRQHNSSMYPIPISPVNRCHQAALPLPAGEGLGLG